MKSHAFKYNISCLLVLKNIRFNNTIYPYYCRLYLIINKYYNKYIIRC